MPVLTFPIGSLDSNAYLLYRGKDAILVDPPADYAPIQNAIKAHGLTLWALLCTHLHFDHVSGCGWWQKHTGLPVLVGKEDWDFKDTLLGRAGLFGFPPVEPFEGKAQEPGAMQWGALSCTLIHCPGHSPGSLCCYCAEEKAVFSGDVLFYHSVGRADLPGGNAKQLMESIRTGLYTLPPNTLVYPGHGPESSIGDEAAHNPFCRL